MDKSLFEKLAAQEADFLRNQFLSPVLRNKPVRVKIAGIVMTLEVTKPKAFQGWGVFAPRDYREARLVRHPNMAERQEYLKLFPTIRFVLCRRQDEQWFGSPAKRSGRFRIQGLVPIHLTEEVQMFDVVRTRFDGVLCWYEGPDNNYSGRTAAYLRESLANLVEPEKLACAGLTQEERDAYCHAYGPALEADIEAKRDKTEDRLRHAVERAGARFRSYIERDDSYTIEMVIVDPHGREQSYHPVVSKENLQVMSAGICLSGQDRTFDLQSLVPVYMEGQNRHLIHRYGHDAGHYDEDDDW